MQGQWLRGMLICCIKNPAWKGWVFFIDCFIFYPYFIFSKHVPIRGGLTKNNVQKAKLPLLQNNFNKSVNFILHILSYSTILFFTAYITKPAVFFTPIFSSSFVRIPSIVRGLRKI